MTEITASMVKELREETNVGMMDCKRALQETNGDKAEAIKILRERGVAIAGKRAERAVKEGIITAEVAEDGSSAFMYEVNCETDFVARNESFQAFVASLAEKAKTAGDNELAEAAKDELTDQIASIGENLVISRNINVKAAGTGLVAKYIHMGGKVGVLVDAGCEKDETKSNATFVEMVKDITLHIAAANPQYLNREEVPQSVIDEERAIYVKQVEGKPENIIDKIVTGKLDKYFSQVCLLEQPFVKDNDLTITQLIESTGKEVGDTLSVRSFVRYQVGA